MKRKYKLLVALITILLALIIGAGFFAGNYFYNLALNPDTDKTAVLDAPHNLIDSNSDEAREKEAREQWFNKHSEEKSIPSFDSLKLHAYSIQNSHPTDKWAIIFHGYSSDGTQMTKYAKQFYDMGYHVLIPDARGHGQSEGDYIGMGWHDRFDVISWIDDIVNMNEDAEIVLFGVSMGGATVMMASGEDLPSNVKAIIEDCGYSSVWDEFS